MTNDEYLSTQNLLLLVGAAAEQLDLDGMLRAIANAETLGPVLNPTLFRDSAEPMEEIKRLAEAMQTVQARARAIRVMARKRKAQQQEQQQEASA